MTCAWGRQRGGVPLWAIVSKELELSPRAQDDLCFGEGPGGGGGVLWALISKKLGFPPTDQQKSLAALSIAYAWEGFHCGP